MHITSKLEQPVLNSGQLEPDQHNVHAMFSMEFHPHHNICTLSLRTDAPNVQIKLRSNQVEFSVTNRNERICFQMPPSFTINLKDLDTFDTGHIWTKLEDGTMSSTYCPSPELAFIKCRMLNQPDVPTPRLIRDEFVEICRRVHDLRCHRCSTSMLREPILFKRALPLPAGGLSLSGTDFFCHRIERHTGDNREVLREAVDAEEAALAEENVEKAVAALNIAQAAVEKVAVEGLYSDRPSLEIQDPVLKSNKTGQPGTTGQEAVIAETTELYFTVNKFVVDENILSDQVKKSALGDSMLCPACRTIVGIIMPPERDSVVRTRKLISFYRIRTSLVNPETQEAIETLTSDHLIAKLMRQLIAYKFQVRLFLFSESSPDVLVVYVMENDICVYNNEISLQDSVYNREIQFKKKHKVLYTKTIRSSPYIQHCANMVEVLKQTVLQDTLDLIYDSLIASTTSNLFQDELEFDGHQIGYIEALV